MICPVCNRNLVSTLSICPACGTMMGDSEREQITVKKSPVANKSVVKPNEFSNKGKIFMPVKPSLKPTPKPFLSSPKPFIKGVTTVERNVVEESRKEIQKTVTANLGVKPTSPTLVDFQHKESALPEWRLELKNAVRQKLQKNAGIGDDETFPAPRVINRTHGATALKPEYSEETADEPVLHENETVQNALKRIQKSREKFLVIENEIAVETIVETAPKKDYPYYIAARSSEVFEPQTETKTPEYTIAKPKLISSIPAENFKRDTNKLPPLPTPAKISTSFSRKIEADIIDDVPPMPKDVILENSVEIVSAQTEITITPQKSDDFIETEEIEIIENEDLAPFAMRFNAGIFDLIIGGFTSLILLAPFVLLGGNWFTTAGLFAFLATCSIVMFIYLTTAVGLFGRTFGMKMFALEIIDVEENDYPTFHQAAVSAAVYLLSLALGGTGFLTVLFTDDKRAVHDIVSGTLMVKDYQEVTA